MSVSDTQLKAAVAQVFKSFDKDNSGFLDTNEATQLLNAALTHMKAGRKATPE
jgi:Ca2+-binding EF-hand superfamily protein